MNNMDQEVKPCENFYKYACGNFIKNTVIPDDQTKVNAFTNVETKIRGQLKAVIEDNNNLSLQLKPFKLVTDLYSICMNKSQYNEPY